MKTSSVLLVLFLGGLAISCGSGNGVMGGSETILTDVSEAETPPITLTCSNDSDCDDKIACTEDICLQGDCQHVLDNSKCGTGEVCDISKGGCTKAKSCFSDAHCKDNMECTVEGCDQQTNLCQQIYDDSRCPQGYTCFSPVNFENDGKGEDGEDEEYSGCLPTSRCKNDADCLPDESSCAIGKCVAGICVYAANFAKCDDGDVCNGQEFCQAEEYACGFSDGSYYGSFPEYCNNYKCHEGEQRLECNDQNHCTDDGCDPEKGCIYENNKAPCEDGEICTKSDKCSDGTCVSGPPTDCDDNNPCTKDYCKAGQPPCYGNQYDAFVCQGIMADSSGDGSADAETVGCNHKPDPAMDGESCATPCLKKGICSAGKCSVGAPVDCNDKNPCTEEWCDPLTGCQYVDADGEDCNDGNTCTINDYCQKKTCVAGEAKDCDDEISCTIDSCKPSSGCVYTPNNALCNDNDLCTGNEICSLQSGCVSPNPLNCDDGIACTIDSCDPSSGCLHTPNNALCDDKIPCTSDSCNPSSGCLHTPNNAMCNDNNVCTGDEICSPQSGCISPNPLNCDDNNICTDDPCDPVIGCKHVNNTIQCAPIKCEGGKAYEAVTCSDGSCPAQVLISCNDTNPCTDDSCEPAVGCKHMDNVTPCNDSEDCTVMDTCTNGICAGQPKLFDKTYDGTDWDKAYALAALPDGGFVLAGQTGYTWDKKSGNFWLVRADVAGNLLWSKTFGGGMEHGAFALTTLPDGGFALAGSTNSKGAGWSDFWLVRTDTEGNLLWDKTYGGSANDIANALVALPDGGFALAGLTYSKGAYGGGDLWLVRTDATGNLLWDKNFGGNATDYASALVALPDDGFALAGYTSSKGAGLNDFWLVRTDTKGNLLWDKTYGGSANNIANALVALPDGGFALAGYTNSKGAGSNDFWLVRTDTEGNLLWDKTYGGSASDYANALVNLPDGGFALAGSTNSKGAGWSDFWLVRTDTEGNLLWDKTYGGFANDIANALVYLPDGGFALAGSLESQGTSWYDFWLVRTDAEGNLICK